MVTDEIISRLVRESFLATGYSSPNPPVASVATDLDGKILFSAHTQKTGQNHSERELYRLWEESGKPLIPHNLFVSLEPCSHFGRTPPCLDLVLERKPNYLYVGSLDPHPLVFDKHKESLGRLKNASIQWVESDELKKTTYPFLNGFFSRVKFKKPKIIYKTAVTREGYFANPKKERIQISSKSTSSILQMLRGKVDAILVGPGTILSDKPSLHFKASLLESNSENPELFRSSIFREEKFNQLSFWDALYSYSWNQDIIKYHIERENDYQPIRVFYIERELPLSKWNEFISHQFMIQKKYPHSRILFYFAQAQESYSDLFLDAVKDLGKLYFFPEKDNAKLILSSLAEEGVNLLMVEGGNAIYEKFYPFLQDEDEIFVVTNRLLSWKEGIRPYYGKYINDWTVVWETEMGRNSENLLQVYKRK